MNYYPINSLLIIGALFFTYNIPAITQRALIPVPVADLVGEPLHTKNSPVGYATMPVCNGGTQQALNACLRVHQALFNEIVTILGETDTEYQVAITNAYYVTEKTDNPCTHYWTLKKNCTVLNTLTQKNPPIPAPINFNNPSSMSNKQILTLDTTVS